MVAEKEMEEERVRQVAGIIMTDQDLAVHNRLGRLQCESARNMMSRLNR